MMTNEAVRGFVIRTQTYREADNLLTLFTGDGLFTCILRGYFKPKSKQLGLGQLYSYVEVNAELRSQHIARIQSGKVLRHPRIEFEWLKGLALASEIVLLQSDENDFQDLYSAFEALYQASAIQAWLCYFLARIIQINGITPQIDHCLYCDRQQIRSFSVEQGGFLCVEHQPLYDPLHHYDVPDVLRQLRYLMLADDRQFAAISSSFTMSSTLLELLVSYVQFHLSIHLKSWDFYQKI